MKRCCEKTVVDHSFSPPAGGVLKCEECGGDIYFRTSVFKIGTEAWDGREIELYQKDVITWASDKPE